MAILVSFPTFVKRKWSYVTYWTSFINKEINTAHAERCVCKSYLMVT